MTHPLADAQVVIIAAVARNGVIGVDNRLPWRLPEDQRRFRRLTMGHPIIVGRRTFESFGRPLPGRTNIVLSRDPSFAPSGCLVRGDFDAAVATGLAANQGDVFVAGGTEVYRRALEIADRIELTVVEADVDGDAYFPDLDEHGWTCQHRARPSHTGPQGLRFAFHTYVRRRTGSAEPGARTGG